MPMIQNANGNIYTRRVALINNPYTNQTTGLPWILGQDNRGYQYQIALDALPPGVNVNQVKQNQVWFVDNSTTAYRLKSYAGTTDNPITIASGTFVGLNNYGSYVSTVTQSGDGHTVQTMSYDAAIVNASGMAAVNGVTIVSGTQITLENPGVYNIQFSAQIVTTTASKKDIYIWLSHSGVDVKNSATKLTLAGSDNALVAAWNWFTPTTTVGQYFEIKWYSTDTSIKLAAFSAVPANGLAAPSPAIPGIPSVILTVNQVA